MNPTQTNTKHLNIGIGVSSNSDGRWISHYFNWPAFANSKLMAFPIARKLWHLGMRARQNWLLRHQSRFSFAIHMVGIPLALLSPMLLFIVEWYWAVAAFFVGYLLQWIGHKYEGNDVGEFIPIKKALGLPTVSIAPQYLPTPPIR